MLGNIVHTILPPNAFRHEKVRPGHVYTGTQGIGDLERNYSPD